MADLSVADALALSRRDYEGDDGMNGGWFWIVILFLFAAMGGNGFGFGGNNAGLNTINNDFLYTNLKNTMDMGFNQVANQNFGIQKDLCQGFNSVNGNVSDLGYRMQNCLTFA